MPEMTADKVILLDINGKELLTKSGLGIKFETPAAIDISVKIVPKATALKAKARGYVGVPETPKK